MITMTVEDWLSREIAARGTTKSALAKEIPISKAYMSMICSGDRPLPAWVAKRLQALWGLDDATTLSLIPDGGSRGTSSSSEASAAS